MEQSNLFTIQVRDQDVYYVKVDGRNLVLIRPICDVFGIDADRQIRDLKTDEILSGEVSEQTTRLPHDDRKRPYTCLPEAFIYGWLMSIKFSNTMSDDTKAYLIAYKRECYHVLYNYFHGRVKEADERLRNKVQFQKKLDAKKSKLFNENEDYREILELEAQLKSLGDPYAKLGRNRKIELMKDLFSQN
jgi:hypothetical protein